MDDNLASISTNCAALGSALLITQRSYGLAVALVFASLRRYRRATWPGQLCQPPDRGGPAACPRPFRGIPIQLITAGLMAMALLGFYGLTLD